LKTLILVRHAKSSWDDPGLNDFDRPLNDRGKKDAPKMAERLFKKKIEVDAFISSPAKRAARTAKIFAEEFKVKKEDIIFKTELYLASENVFYDVITKTDDELDTIAVFSHNPGITDFANDLTEIKIDNIPTCGVFAVKIDTKHWIDIKDAKKEFWFFDYPKAEE
jgi:phosphohistidine phosphatase